MESFYAVISAYEADSGVQTYKTLVARKICGKPVINWVKDAVNETGASETVIFADNKTKEALSCVSDGAAITGIFEALETGPALIDAARLLEGKKGACLFVCADKPLITSETLNMLLEFHFDRKNTITVLTGDPALGRNFGPGSGETENKAEMPLDMIISEIKRTGVYVIESGCLGKYAIDYFNSENRDYSQDKLFESIMAKIINDAGKVGAITPLAAEELLCVNCMAEFSKAHKILNNRIIERHMKNGVAFLNPESCIIENDVAIGQGTLVYPGTILEGSTSIGEDCVIGPNALLRNVTTGKHVTVINSVAMDSSIDDDTKVGPFAYLRPGSQIGKNVKIGDFVEIKNSLIGDDTKISHLTYVGDAEIGKNVNLGCGVVVVNYDGQKKHRTIVGDNSFIGCNVNLVSPVEVKPNAFVAAGSTITEEVPEYSLAIARSRQTIIADWVLKKGRVRGT